MSRTRRASHYSYFRQPQTLNELKQVKVSPDFYSEEYPVSFRHRYIARAWDDKHFNKESPYAG